ncbi:hypothetical protein [Metabacillus idriensis]|uniref:hypothetical protein n=1 Tax=Metabacillus idriensis TaxID=324768 RepID=UPI0017498005|nr:hypothetical protein [Metabacillus idriensis]
MGFGVEAYELYNYLQWVLGIMIYIFLPAVLLFKTGKRKEKQGQAFQTQPIFEDRTIAEAPWSAPTGRKGADRKVRF